ncbi:unnamed protein product [Mytilus coruscus]|uniref:Uncharacterized protein n=1 Tax=Mytilus coruscus TaxID=42192 RepID=A0A6J8ELM5_MYTCO|nr:unnamed protein product [Mytilus coruscus]
MMKEQARSQVFLALFNITVDTKRSVSELGSLMDSRIHELGQNQTAVISEIWDHVKSYQIRQNNTLSDIENSIFETRKSANETYRNLQSKINTNTEKAVSVVHGFLLDTQKPGTGQAGTANQYLTVTEFYDEKKLLQQETSQLQLRFEALEHSLREDG